MRWGDLLPGVLMYIGKGARPGRPTTVVCGAQCEKVCRVEARCPALKSSMQRRGVFRERGQQSVLTLLEGMHELLGCALAAVLLHTSC